jgi:hypothetical protein
MPEISFVQSIGAHADLENVTTGAMTPSAGSILVAFGAGDCVNGPMRNLSISDSQGNTWRSLAPCCADAVNNGVPVCRPFVCFSPAVASTTFTMTQDGTLIRLTNISVIEFSVPASLIQYGQSDYYANQQGSNGIGGASPPFTMPTGVMQMPGPGLYVAGGVCDRSDMSLDAGNYFTALPSQSNSGITLYPAYAIMPQGAQSCSWTKSNSLSVYSACSLVGFLIPPSAVGPRPRLIAGKGATW